MQFSDIGALLTEMTELLHSSSTKMFALFSFFYTLKRPGEVIAH